MMIWYDRKEAMLIANHIEESHSHDTTYEIYTLVDIRITSIDILDDFVNQ